ncbi:MAG: zf-HC2 domain-containing protein [Lachnospiraceae bacterium]|nr:zf-HC2 domain-containing protein [Lachnospiraceae bacterium]
MKYECNMIRDLLPLYKDGACSPESTKAVEEHLSECPSCKELLTELKDTSLDEMIVREKEEVIDSQSRFFKRKTALAGSIIAGILALPILICFIVDLANGKGLSWFFIVLAAMLIPTSLFVVPLMAPENRMFYTMCSFTVTVILLLAVCCIYSGGKWFFVAASAVLFGLTVCFSPFIACRRPVNKYLKDHKGLAVMAADTVTFFLMMLCIGLHVATPGYFKTAFGISTPLVAMAWIMFLIIRYLPVHGLAKAGICVVVLNVAAWIANSITAFIMTRDIGDSEVVISTTPSIGYTVIGIVIGAILTVIGFMIGKKKEAA